MEIISVKPKHLLSDGRVRSEYLLSSPVTLEVLEALSQGAFVSTGRQYLSPTYQISKPEGIEISGILKSPVIVVHSLPGMSTGIEDYLHGFLSTIPDSESPEWYLLTVFHQCINYLKKKLHGR
jgi:hypothetical protein